MADGSRARRARSRGTDVTSARDLAHRRPRRARATSSAASSWLGRPARPRRRARVTTSARRRGSGASSRGRAGSSATQSDLGARLGVARWLWQAARLLRDAPGDGRLGRVASDRRRAHRGARARAARSYFEYHPRASRAQIRLARGEPDDVVLVDIRRAAEVARAARDPQAMVPGSRDVVFVTAELGLRRRSRQTLERARAARGRLTARVHRTISLAFCRATARLRRTSLRRLAERRRPQPMARRRRSRSSTGTSFACGRSPRRARASPTRGTPGCEPARRISPRGRRAEAEQQLQRALDLLPAARRDALHPRRREALLSRRGSQRFPRSACSRSIASKSDLKLPIPKPREPWRSITSKKSVGRSWTIFVKSCSR